MASALTNDSSDRTILKSSPGFREFPWQCGFVLQQGSLEKRLKWWLEDQPMQFPDVEKSILLVSDQHNCQTSPF